MRQDDFYRLFDTLQDGLRGDEVLFAGLDAERSDFVRLNENRVRQAGSVDSAGLGLTLIDGGRQVEGGCQLGGNADADLAQARALLGQLRERIAHVPDDPYLNYSTAPATSERSIDADLPATVDAIGALTDLAAGLDLVGIWAAGAVVEALASSIGHRHWHASKSFNLDWSCYLDRDKAVKASYSGFDWDPGQLRHKVNQQRAELYVLGRAEHRIEPGRYRAYLAPAALAELMDLLAWGGFGLRDHRTRQTPLLQLATGEKQLSPKLTIIEEHQRGLAAGFTDEGFTKPDQVKLIEEGWYQDCLTDARSAKEYDAVVNAAAEYPESLAIAPGELAGGDALRQLDTGILIGNLWYCNWSDRNACRMTGMTRFGTFWVENGEPVAPLAVMRFDDSLYHLLGDRLEGLTAERELRLSAETYDGRGTDSALLPGALVTGIDLAL
ncbi:MAG: peptidase [Thiohalocapsa sp.]|jgi:predicted Zn-dependent protease|uniref:TldD/PmbA family protein n=1 Tax=Thiohalocapsa sp. TaxID=2497641 RepID=UPI0025CCEA0B|nr:metallopeptidase TldD-related protein [Thiohalocapsa sp.]MCG6940463.1 peptidase [Thiohalocapsa sp.]